MRIIRLSALIAGLALWSAAVAQTPLPQGPPAPAGKQAIYDSAQEAFDKNDWTAAAVGFVQLLPSGGDAPLRRSETVIAARYAAALVRLDRLVEAQAWIDRALATFPQDDAVGLAEAWMTKGDVERFRYDYTAALDAYDRADTMASAVGATELVTRVRMAEAIAGATVDPGRVGAKLAALTADPVFAKAVDKRLLAQIEDLQARAAINAGDKDAAGRLAGKAVSDSGGLTERVSVLQVTIRADAGIISRLRGSDEEARRYLTYTGAGHLKDTSWVSDHAGDLPVCDGPDGDIRPTDSVVVAFAIADDGRVIGTLPVYATRPGQLGVTFARAVARWRWNAEKINKVDAFWRSTLQLELRCVSRPSPQGLGRAVWQEAGNWLAKHRLSAPGAGSANPERSLPDIRADDPRLAQPQGAVLAAVAAPLPDRVDKIDALWGRLDAVEAPPAAYAILIQRWSNQQARAADSRRAEHRRVAEGLATWTPKFRQRFPNDHALAWLVVSEALAREDSGDFKASQALLSSLLGDAAGGLAGDDPLRPVALLHQAIDLDHNGDPAAAKASLERSGLNRDQCSLLDTHPIAQNLAIGSSAYPDDALHWHFEGFVQEAFDIADDGSVTNIRTVVAYPPYIFEATTERAVRTFRFIPPRLGGKAVGCEAQRQVVNYRLAP